MVTDGLSLLLVLLVLLLRWRLGGGVPPGAGRASLQKLHGALPLDSRLKLK